MKNKNLEKIVAEVDLRDGEIIKFALDLVNKLSETPPGDETEVADVIKKYSSKWGLPKPEIWALKYVIA